MISYFRFKNQKGNAKKDIILREKKSVFDKKPKERYISKKGNIAIFGINASGKSRKIQSIYDEAPNIWRAQIIYLKATDSISEIFARNLESEKETQALVLESAEGEEIEVIDTSKHYIKLQALANKAKQSVVIIDDCDKLTGKKLELAKDLLKNCKSFVISAKDEQSLNKTIHRIIKAKRNKTSYIQLSSKASMDASNILFLGFVVVLLFSGAHELAIVVMAGRFLMKGLK